jgi:hypothetical protein
MTSCKELFNWVYDTLVFQISCAGGDRSTKSPEPNPLRVFSWIVLPGMAISQQEITGLLNQRIVPLKKLCLTILAAKRTFRANQNDHPFSA